VEGIAIDAMQFCKAALVHSIKVPGRSRTLRFPRRGGGGRQTVSGGGGFDPRRPEIEGQAVVIEQQAWTSKGARRLLRRPQPTTMVAALRQRGDVAQVYGE
jgi:hypothetical protein